MLFGVHRIFGLHSETLFLAVHLVDRYLQPIKYKLDPRKLQLVALVLLMILQWMMVFQIVITRVILILGIMVMMNI